jgi:hypothetical protein
MIANLISKVEVHPKSIPSSLTSTYKHPSTSHQKSFTFKASHIMYLPLVIFCPWINKNNFRHWIQPQNLNFLDSNIYNSNYMKLSMRNKQYNVLWLHTLLFNLISFVFVGVFYSSFWGCFQLTTFMVTRPWHFVQWLKIEMFVLKPYVLKFWSVN